MVEDLGFREIHLSHKIPNDPILLVKALIYPVTRDLYNGLVLSREWGNGLWGLLLGVI